MARIKIDIPEHWSFITEIPIRITDLNYGGHVGNDTVLSLLHEARVRFLRHHGFEEFNAGAAGLIMGDVAIEFKKEIFYGDHIIAAVTAGEFSRVSFDLFYKLEKQTDAGMVTVAFAKTGMVCYSYDQKKIIAVPEALKTKLSVG
jgi:acyl-CoA thioester hydrolase